MSEQNQLDELRWVIRELPAADRYLIIRDPQADTNFHTSTNTLKALEAELSRVEAENAELKKPCGYFGDLEDRLRGEFVIEMAKGNFQSAFHHAIDVAREQCKVLVKSIHSAIYAMDCIKEGSIIYSPSSVRKDLCKALDDIEKEVAQAAIREGEGK